MDITNLIIQLQAKVNDLTYNQLAVAKSIELLKTGQVNYVNSISELPSATASNGKMYYVRSLGIYYSNGTSWTTIETINYIIENYIWSWGYNSSGQLGDNTIVSKSSPVSIVGGFTDWSQISAGSSVSLAIRQNGTAWAWGVGSEGALGDNTVVNKSSPVSVAGGFTDWCQVEAGSHSLAVRQNGTAWAWGGNGGGQLGDNTIATKSSPVSVIGGFTDWCQISAGINFSLAVRQNGTAWGWGCGYCGSLGNNATANTSSPVSVVGGFTDWCQISAGNRLSVAVRTNGTAWAWGCNNCGQLGTNNITSRSSPVSVVGDFTDWCQVSAGDLFSLAVRQNGTAWGWGTGGQGQLGIGASTSHSSPVSVVGGFTDWCQISAGNNFSLAVRQNGTAWAWGEGTGGRLGNNATTIRNSPVSVAGGFCDWSQISAGIGSSLAIRKVIDS